MVGWLVGGPDDDTFIRIYKVVMFIFHYFRSRYQKFTVMTLSEIDLICGKLEPSGRQAGRQPGQANLPTDMSMMLKLMKITLNRGTYTCQLILRGKMAYLDRQQFKLRHNICLTETKLMILVLNIKQTNNMYSHISKEGSHELPPSIQKTPVFAVQVMCIQ